jgi:HAD superfamily hydrolase (TIGR01450 family)
MKDYFNKKIENLREKKLWLFDMDGTVYLGNTLFEGVKELLSAIKENGGRYIFITNNSSKSTVDYVKKLIGMGIEVTEENFYTSAEASAKMLKEKFGEQKIYAQGTKSFVQGLKEYGLNVTEEPSEDIASVIVGFDRELTMQKLENTCIALLKDVPYYATNPDWVCPTEFGYVPDCGSMCFGLEKATGKKPEFIGKPMPTMINAVMDKFGVSKEQTIVLGDRIYTDIASGYNAGVDTILVLSGEATLKDYEESEIKPTFVLNHVKDIKF